MSPTSQRPTPVLDAHREQLRAAFLDWLVEMAPSDVLDLGAGAGALVAALRGRGIASAGIEASADRVDEARSLDRLVDRGSAEDVDRPDDSVGWVTLRHVLHHLERPERALGEAVRVARDGLLIAEPTSRTELPMHAPNIRLESALRALDRARGMFHGDDLSPAHIVAMLPPTALVEVRILAPMTPLPREEVLRLVERSAGGLPIGAAEQESIAVALDAADAGWLAPSGTAMIAARFDAR